MNIHEKVPKLGEYLLRKRALLKPRKEVQEIAQKKNLFKTICKEIGKCCKLIIDNDSTNNLVSIEMVDKLDLKMIPHPTLPPLED